MAKHSSIIKALQEQLALQKSYEEKYHRLMSALRYSRMQHGDCKSTERYNGTPMACTACMAIQALDKELAEYKGRTVRLA